MTHDSQKHHRRSIRLKGYDYSLAGAYFITVCAQDRACLFGEVIDSQMRLNDAGQIVLAEWIGLAVRFPAVELDAFSVMPNHIHGIIAISTADLNNGAVGAGLVPAPLVPAPGVTTEADGATTRRATTRVAPTRIGGDIMTRTGGDLATGNGGDKTTRTEGARSVLGDIVGTFKSLTTDLYIHGVRQSGWPPFRGRLWQRNYYEHIIRNDRSLNHIRQYILDNPAHWASDPENPQGGSPQSP